MGGGTVLFMFSRSLLWNCSLLGVAVLPEATVPLVVTTPWSRSSSSKEEKKPLKKQQAETQQEMQGVEQIFAS